MPSTKLASGKRRGGGGMCGAACSSSGAPCKNRAGACPHHGAPA
jgi:hypothetical protein